MLCLCLSKINICKKKNHKYTADKCDCRYDSIIDTVNKGDRKMCHVKPKSDLARVRKRVSTVGREESIQREVTQNKLAHS